MTSGWSSTSFTVAAKIPGVVSWESMKKVNIKLTALSMSKDAPSFFISSNKMSRKSPSPSFDAFFFWITPFSSFVTLLRAYSKSYLNEYIFTERRWNEVARGLLFSHVLIWNTKIMRWSHIHLHESINSRSRNTVRETKPICSESSPTKS